LEYNTEMRLQRAAELLKNKKNKVREVSLAVGYENVSYFGVVFQKRFGVTPNEYRKMV
jgi:two-component system response regulator YesN